MNCTLQKNENGTLSIKLSASNEEKQELIERMNKYGETVIFLELMEPYYTNGWGVYTADQLGQMSECLVICEDALLEDSGEILFSGKAWTNIHNYQIANAVEDLVEQGEILFHLWEDFSETPTAF